MQEQRTRGTPQAILLTCMMAVLAGCGQPEEASAVTQAQTVVTAQSERRPHEDEVILTAPERRLGSELYDFHCAICHGARGDGGVGPALADNPNMQVADYVVAQVLLGGGGMPPFAPRLTDGEVAAVVSFVRSSWGNDAGPIGEQQVGTQRSGLRPGLRLGPTGGGPIAADGPGGLSAGERIYVQQGCSGCHGAQGGGGVGPALAGNDRLADGDMVIEQILNGGGGMPAFARQLSDEEIAAVASHERSAWGNDFGAIEGEQVARLRRSSEEGQ